MKIISRSITTPEKVRKRIDHYSSLVEQDGNPVPAEFPDNRKGPIIGAISKALKFNGLEDRETIDYYRYLIWGWLFCSLDEPLRPLASIDLTPRNWNALNRWNSERIGKKYRERPSFKDELRWILYRAQKDYQKTLENPETPFREFFNAWDELPKDGDHFGQIAFVRHIMKTHNAKLIIEE